MKLADLPSEFTGPAAWIGRDMRQRKREWLIELTSADIADLETAAHHFHSLGRDIGEIKTPTAMFSVTSAISAPMRVIRTVASIRPQNARHFTRTARMLSDCFAFGTPGRAANRFWSASCPFTMRCFRAGRTCW